MIKEFFSLLGKLLEMLSPTQIFILMILCILSTVVISLYGKIMLKWGKKTLGLGAPKNSEYTLQDVPPMVSPTPDTKKRTCGDCILLVIGEREKVEHKKNMKENRILKDQMIFAEQKIIEIQSIFTDDYAQQIKSNKKETNTLDDQTMQNKMYYGLLRDSLLVLKDEIRRAFKENGFYEIDGNDFSAYVKDKAKNLVSKMSQYMRNLYPTGNNTIVSLDTVIENIDRHYRAIEDITFEVFIKAKDTKVASDRDIKTLDIEFVNWVDNFIN